MTQLPVAAHAPSGPVLSVTPYGNFGGSAFHLAGALRPRERGQPRLAVVRRPRLVLQQRDRAPAGAAGRAQVQHRPDEAAAAQAVPAPGDLDPVRAGALEALELEVDLR